MRRVIEEIIDRDSFFEIHKDYADNIVVGFARLAGKCIGIVANQPISLAGVLDVESSKKAARFTRFCDCFNIPLISISRCTWFSARNRPRMEWYYNKWSKIIICFKRSDSSQSDRDHEKSVRWCL